MKRFLVLLVAIPLLLVVLAGVATIPAHLQIRTIHPTLPAFDALARALKQKGVATAGVDRMRLSRQLAVRDLMALAETAVLPEDDLALACLLKSPLCLVTEDELFDLAHGRGGLAFR